MTVLSVTEARRAFADTFNRVLYKGERIIVGKRGGKQVAIVPIEDLALIERIEDEMDAEKAKRAFEEGGRTPLEEVKKQLGL
jgi:prevent-host-death family protein